MSKNKKHIIPSLLILAIILAAGIYYFYLRDIVILAYKGKEPGWFNFLINTFYPRFEVEKQRFGLGFFLQKADQIILRFSFICTIIVVAYFFITNSDTFKSKISNFWNATTSAINYKLLRVFFYFFMFLIFKDIYHDMISLSQAEVFYKPIFIFKTLHIPFPSQTGILVIYIVLIVSYLCCIFNFQPLIFSIIAILNFILIQGYIFSFEKTDHGFATFTYAGLIMPFFIYENYKSQKTNSKNVAAWPLQLIVTAICLCYFLTGLEKVFISHFQWLKPETFKAYLQIHQAPLGLKVANNDFLCITLPALTLLLQLGFISILFYPKLKWIFIPAGILFHISTYFLFNVGGFTNPWILVYIFFIDWGELLERWKR